MECRNCKYFYTNDTMDGLYLCVNGNSDRLGEFTGVLCVDDCEYGVSDADIEESEGNG